MAGRATAVAIATSGMIRTAAVDIGESVGVDAYPAEALPFAIDKIGLGYRARCGVLTLDLSHLRESRGELTGELTVSVGEHHVSRARLNLSNLSGRVSHARYLAGVPVVSEVPWRDLLERLSLDTLNLHRAGADITELDITGPDPRCRWLLDPVLPLDMPTILFAPGGAGKSTIAAAIGVSVDSGVEVIPGWRPVSAPVLALDWEDGAGVWTKRTRAIAAGAGVKAPRIRYQPQVRPLPESVDRLAAYVADEAIGLVIVDSVGLASGSARDGGTAEESTLRLFQALRQLDATCLLIDHVRGDDMESDRAISRPYGSVYKTNLARSVYELRRERDGSPGRAELLMVHTKVNDGAKQSPQGLAIVYEDGGRVIRFERAEPQAPELIGALTSKDRMVRMLRDGATTTAAIAAELDIKPRSVDAMVSRYRTLFAGAYPTAVSDYSRPSDVAPRFTHVAVTVQHGVAVVPLRSRGGPTVQHRDAVALGRFQPRPSASEPHARARVGAVHRAPLSGPGPVRPAHVPGLLAAGASAAPREGLGCLPGPGGVGGISPRRCSLPSPHITRRSTRWLTHDDRQRHR
jgi:hypothetical protein